MATITMAKGIPTATITILIVIGVMAMFAIRVAMPITMAQHVVPFHDIPSPGMACHNIQCHGMARDADCPWHGMAWHGMAWHE